MIIPSGMFITEARAEIKAAPHDPDKVRVIQELVTATGARNFDFEDGYFLGLKTAQLLQQQGLKL